MSFPEWLQIRRLSLNSAPTLQRLRDLVDMEGTLGSASERQRARAIKFIESQLCSPFETVGAFVSENLIGSASLSPVPKHPWDSDSSNWFGLAGIIVHPDFRRQGIGKALVLECLSRVEHQGGNGVLLEVNVPNPARAMYESLGFEEWNANKSAYQHNGQGFDQISMRKHLELNRPG
jgi:ribosomal protein S18 acetylase RimI-like enzyme